MSPIETQLQDLINRAEASTWVSVGQFGALPCLNIAHPKSTAQLVLQGAHVTHWQPHGQQPVFWMSHLSTGETGKAIRGGVPVCWPWFGTRPEGNHGTARTRDWEVTALTADDDGVSVALSFRHTTTDGGLVTLVMNVFFGEGFSQELTVINHTDAPFEFTGALHNYFQVKDVTVTEVPNLNHVKYLDKIEQFAEKSQQGIPSAQGPKDRVYQCHTEQLIDDAGYQREIALEPLNTSQWVLWNPGPEIVRGFADIDNEQIQHFVCLEAAITTPQTVGSGQRFTWGQAIEVRLL